jgi:DNA polymerase elongation subunit (family B)
MPSTPRRIVFDIETIGENFDELDKTTQESLTRWIEKDADDPAEYSRLLDDLKNGLGFSPLTGSIVAVGVLDVDKEKGAVYYQAPGAKDRRTEDGPIAYEAMDEAGLLKKFWEIASQYDVFITFNGRAFDVPFLMVRSAVHKVLPTKNLMAGRYLYQHHADAVHIDLLDQLSFYGAVRRKGSLHLWCRAFGVKSPKSEGVTGDDVSLLFKKKRYLDIAKYNAGDLWATREVFLRWNEYLNV